MRSPRPQAAPLRGVFGAQPYARGSIPPAGHDEIRPPPSADLKLIVAAGKPDRVGSVSPSIWKPHQGRPWRWLRMALSASWRRGGSRSRSTTRTRSSQRADHGADLHRWHRPQEASPVWGGLIRWARGALYEGSEDDDRDCQPVRGHHSADADVGLEVCRGANLGAYLGQRASTGSARDPGGTRIVTEVQGGLAYPCRS